MIGFASSVVDNLAAEALNALNEATGGALNVIGDALSTLGLLDDNYVLISSRERNIGGIIPDVSVEEVGTDILQITEHPVETGAAISDHAYKRPAEVVMRCGFSDSTAGSLGYSQERYDALLSLQASRIPFDLYTGKRVYSDMLVAGITQTTDGKSEFALMVTLLLRQIILTSSMGAGSAPTSAMGSPQTTGDVSNTGARATTGGFDESGFVGAFGGAPEVST